MLRKIVPDPFLLILVGTVLLASFLPARGAFAIAVSWLATATVVLLFFFHGAKLAREQILAGITHWRLHLAILGTTFVLFPLIGIAATKGLAGYLPAPLLTGILFLTVLPSTVQSAIAFVGIAHGNVGAAVASASASQMLGVVLTPLLMSLLAGTHGGAGGLEGMGEVALQILVPFVVGHLLRPWLKDWIARHKAHVNLTDRSTIIIAVYSAFSAAVLGGIWHQLPPSALAALFAIDAVLLALGLAFTWGLGGLCGFAREDRIALLFCGTKKSLVQGVPMARVLFPGGEAGVIVLPVMIFHQMQLMACAFIARGFARGFDAEIRDEA
ncbi:bile acid:sodium symporter family protein [Sphingomonas sp. BIUV-7]|uniref:Bile acid:sodium symporter family protein n=1 Tax=Sphingomonas natans TaxID=3063330 RepID=A0ABT8YB28_9SPHN|nr:bile acid:sodium symporter family protein [Sphingomonas sp. BIUV-7]MDO6415525.1 bile acid:sodium symporter family protein [Sphingomonas sp. BIUV-7]